MTHTNSKAILFDVDGTLLNTREFIMQAFEHTFKTYGIPMDSRAQLDAVMGRPLEECYARLAPTYNTDELSATHREFQKQNMSLVKAFPNTITTLTELKKRGIKMAVISTRKQTGEKSLKITDIEKFFDVVITGDDVTRFKPEPDGLLMALKKLNMPAHEAMMVGDAPDDILAGKNAHTRTAAALYGLGLEEKLREVKPDYFLQDIADILQII